MADTPPRLRVLAARIIGWDERAQCYAVECRAAECTIEVAFSPGLVAGLVADLEAGARSSKLLGGERARIAAEKAPRPVKHHTRPKLPKDSEEVLAANRFVAEGRRFKGGLAEHGEIRAFCIERALDEANFRRALACSRERGRKLEAAIRERTQ